MGIPIGPLEKNLPLSSNHDWDGIFILDFLGFFAGDFARFFVVFFFGVFCVFVDNSFRSRFQRNQFPDDFAKVETDIDSKEIFFPQFRTRPNAMLKKKKRTRTA